jgi:hypothetical protein
MKDRQVDFRILWTRLFALFMICVLLLPAQQVISYCYPMDRVMIVDCCAGEAEHQQGSEHVLEPALKSSLCCADLSLGEPEIRQVVDSEELLDWLPESIVWLTIPLEQERIIGAQVVAPFQPLSCTPLARGPPPYLKNCVFLL